MRYEHLIRLKLPILLAEVSKEKMSFTLYILFSKISNKHSDENKHSKHERTFYKVLTQGWLNLEIVIHQISMEKVDETVIK